MQQLPIELSKKLSITDICELHTEKPERRPVIITFSFHGEPCTMCMDKSNAESEWLSFSTYEAPTDLSDSFENVLEDDYWPQIKKLYDEFMEQEYGDENEDAERKCRICGCTDDNCKQCIERTGKACHWVEADMCSACSENRDKVQSLFLPSGIIETVVTFLTEYRKMEQNSVAKNKKILKKIIHPNVFDHIVDSWQRRNNDFGDFFLNLDHATQGLLLQEFGLKIDGLTDYIDKKKADPVSMLFANPPQLVELAHRIQKFFYNNGIDHGSIPGFTMPAIPEDIKLCYGNSTNWANYILKHLDDTQRTDVILALVFYLTELGKY